MKKWIPALALSIVLLGLSYVYAANPANAVDKVDQSQAKAGDAKAKTDANKGSGTMDQMKGKTMSMEEMANSKKDAKKDKK